MDQSPFQPRWVVGATAQPSLEANLARIDGIARAAVVNEVDSTNTRLGEIVRAGDARPCVLVAWRQTAGRGRRGRAWDDVDGGNAAVSIALPTDDHEVGLAPLATALALRDVFDDLGVATSLKWPNDVRAVVDGVAHKVAGILVDGHLQASTPAVVIGIGINVDWRGVPMPAQERPRTSVADAIGGDVDRDGLVEAVVRAVVAWWRRLGDDPEGVRAAHLHACDTIGQRVRVHRVDDVLQGQAVDLDSAGGLVVEVDGERITVTAGDVVHVR